MQFKDYYQTLGVGRDATQDQIKRAYRKLARKYHPDVSKETDAEARFKDLGEAYEVLKDPEKRAAYDQFGKDWKAGQDFRPPPDWDAGFEFSGPGGSEGIGGFSDFFENLFGGARRGGPQGFQRGFERSSDGGFDSGFQGARMRSRGEDHHARVLISLADAFGGTTRTLSLRMPKQTPEGRVVTENRSVRVSIPKGVKAGQRIRLTGQGAPGMGGGPKGDLYLEVGFEPHPFFVADGRDILLDVPITPWEAALGATLQIPTLGGKVDFKIPPNSRSGSKLRLKGRGLPGSPAGDQIVSLRIDTPEAKTPEQRALYEKMRDMLPMNPRAALGM
ncbi:MAG: DnaJ C-terminal domain-containing protein [Gammaproteobacteria bacterium]